MLSVEQCGLHIPSQLHGLHLDALQQASIEHQATRDYGCRVEPEPYERMTVCLVTVTWVAAECAALSNHCAASS